MTTEQAIDVAGFVVETDGDVFGLPCLGELRICGWDAHRYPDRLWVYPQAGRLLELRSDSVLIVTEGETLRGWGELDGPTYSVGCADTRWRYHVPVALLDTLADLLGVVLEERAGPPRLNDPTSVDA